jgi:putative endonuclease
MTSNIDIGNKGESLAESFFIGKGFQILSKNYRTSYGEIDLIIRDMEEVIFVEVKTRTNTSFGFGEEGVSKKKMEHMIASAEYYLAEEESTSMDWRIDVFAILMDHSGKVHEMEWFENVA